MTILCYHSVDPRWRSPLAVTPELFERHVAWLAARRRVIALDEAVAALDGRFRLPSGAASITFDDGFAAVHAHALPVLRRHRVPAFVFVVAATLESPPQPVDWVRGVQPGGPSLATLTLEQLRELREAGVGVGSHSRRHRDLPELTDGECLDDLKTSREMLSDLLGTDVRFLAYPRGLHDERVRRLARDAEYTHAFALPEGPEPAGRYSIPRVGVYPGNDVRALRIKLAPWYLPVRTSTAFRRARQVLGRGRAGPPPG